MTDETVLIFIYGFKIKIIEKSVNLSSRHTKTDTSPFLFSKFVGLTIVPRLFSMWNYTISGTKVSPTTGPSHRGSTLNLKLTFLLKSEVDVTRLKGKIFLP